MFSGIVEAVGTVTRVREGERGREISFRTEPAVLAGLGRGGSVAVDGACLTAVRVEEDGFTVEVIGTTLARTIAAGYREGSAVNLERALVMGARLDGHLVQGHVDGIGHLMEVREPEGLRLLRFRIPPEVHASTLLHGSIALNGVSLTVHALQDPDRVEVGIIPHTWKHTNLSLLRPDSPVNVEGDLIGKYVGRLLRRDSGAGPAGRPRSPDVGDPASGPDL